MENNQYFHARIKKNTPHGFSFVTSAILGRHICRQVDCQMCVLSKFPIKTAHKNKRESQLLKKNWLLEKNWTLNTCKKNIVYVFCSSKSCRWLYTYNIWSVNIGHVCKIAMLNLKSEYDFMEEKEIWGMNLEYISTYLFQRNYENC